MSTTSLPGTRGAGADAGAERLTPRRVFERPDDAPALGPTPRWRASAPTQGEFVFARGHRAAPVVLFDEEPFPQPFRVHSPTGYEWGYGGSGPADLALNILARFLDPWDAWLFHQDFKVAHVVTLAPKGDTLDVGRIRRWIERAHQQRFPAGCQSERGDA